MLTGAGKERGWEWTKRFLPLKKEEEGKGEGRAREMGGERRGEEDQRQGGILLQGLTGDRRPCLL